ncbi:MAG: hypothetical protein ABSG61_15815 [Gemmatimonadales bacterium]
MTLRSAGPSARATGLGVALLLIFGLLASQQYTAVDGAVRCLDVFHLHALLVSGNNHLLAQADVFLWHRLLGLFGIAAADPLAYLRLTQLMNAAAAAGSAALVYWIVRTTTSSDLAAVVAATGLAFSRAFLLYATNAAEPMVGLFWSLVAATGALVAARRKLTWPAAVAGIALALGVASYESMLMIAPAALVLLGFGERPRRSIVAFVAAALVASAGIFGLAYAWSGTTVPGAMLRRFIELPGASVWGGTSLSKVANLPLGAVQSLLPVLPSGYGGVRSLLHVGTAPLSIVWLVAALAGVAALGGALVRRFVSKRAALTGDARPVAIAFTAGLAAACFVPLWWDPLYGKLWLLPLALAWAGGGVLVGGPPAGGRRGLARGALLLIGLEIAVNLSWAVPAHRNESPYLEASRVVARTVQPGDLLILDWDPVSELYTALWGTDTGSWNLPSAAVLSGPAALTELAQAVKATHDRGKVVYFVGVLDETPAAWDAFLGRRLRVPFEALDRYRDSAQVVARLGDGPAAVTLRRL